MIVIEGGKNMIEKDSEKETQRKVKIMTINYFMMNSHMEYADAKMLVEAIANGDIPRIKIDFEVSK